jgi:hypothetical protein
MRCKVAGTAEKIMSCGDHAPIRLIARFSVILAPKQYFVGTEVDETVYHVLLQGRTVGPYDRRTIVGMRIKKALTSRHVLIGTDGAQLTVADLLRRRPAQPSNAERRGSVSVVQATFSASLLGSTGRASHSSWAGPARAGDVPGVEGRFAKGSAGQDRVKIVLGRDPCPGVKAPFRAGPAPRRPFARSPWNCSTESAAELTGMVPGQPPMPAAPRPAFGWRCNSSPACFSGLWVAVVGWPLVSLMCGSLRRVY